MSFEGYHRVLCKNGHLEQIDVYGDYDADNWTCPRCKEPVAWSEIVDETNGSDGDSETKLEINKACDDVHYDHYGTRYCTLYYEYKIPKPKE